MPIDWFTVFAQIANFAILMWLLNRFLYRPVLEAMAAREHRIRETVAAAEQERKAADEALSRLHEQEQELAAKRDTVLARARAEAATIRAELLERAREEADVRGAQLRSTLEREWQEFRAELSRRTQDEALSLARQALLELADAPIEERMVDVLLQKLASLDPASASELQQAAKQSTRPMIIRSRFTLPESLREKLRMRLRDSLGAAGTIEFEIQPELIAGVELAFDGHKIAWTLDDFLRSVEMNVRSLVERQAETGRGRS